MIFTLLYTPCVAALGAVYRETNAKWTALVGVWTFATAWMLATFYYQAVNIFVTPAQSSGWLGGITVAFIVILLSFADTVDPLGQVIVPPLN